MNSNIDTENRFAELVSFIRDMFGEHEMPITRDTLIEDDLGITGDEAYNLLVEIKKRYHVDIKEFEFAKYFNDEPSMFDTSKAVKPFTVGHLEKAIIAGRLDEQVINS